MCHQEISTSQVVLSHFLCNHHIMEEIPSCKKDMAPCLPQDGEWFPVGYYHWALNVQQWNSTMPAFLGWRSVPRWLPPLGSLCPQWSSKMSAFPLSIVNDRYCRTSINEEWSRDPIHSTINKDELLLCCAGNLKGQWVGYLAHNRRLTHGGGRWSFPTSWEHFRW